MIFFVGNDGTVISSIPSPVYQGSANANNIYLIAPFAVNLQVTVAFKLPNGVWTERYPMTQVNEITEVINKETGKSYKGWQFSLPNEITQYYGAVTAQFFFYAGQGAVITASSATSFTVERGVPEILPDEPSKDVYDIILNNLSLLQQQVNNEFQAGFAETMLVETKTLPAGSSAKVDVVPVKDSPATAKQFKFDFSIPQGEQGFPCYLINIVEEDFNEGDWRYDLSLEDFIPTEPAPEKGCIGITKDGKLCQISVQYEDDGSPVAYNIECIKEFLSAEMLNNYLKFQTKSSKSINVMSKSPTGYTKIGSSCEFKCGVSETDNLDDLTRSNSNVAGAYIYAIEKDTDTDEPKLELAVRSKQNVKSSILLSDREKIRINVNNTTYVEIKGDGINVVTLKDRNGWRKISINGVTATFPPFVRNRIQFNTPTNWLQIVFWTGYNISSLQIFKDFLKNYENELFLGSGSYIKNLGFIQSVRYVNENELDVSYIRDYISYSLSVKWSEISGFVSSQKQEGDDF